MSIARIISLKKSGQPKGLHNWPTMNIVTDGDSITATGYTTLMVKSLPVQSNVVLNNLAVSGNFTDNLITRLGSVVPPLYDSSKQLNIYTFMIGVNNIHRGDNISSKIIPDYQTIISEARALGFKVMMSTVTPQDDVTTEAQIETLNPQIRSNWQSWGADMLDDFNADTNLDDPTNTNVYSDGLHPGTRGDLYFGQRWYYGISDLLVSLGYEALSLLPSLSPQ